MHTVCELPPGPGPKQPPRPASPAPAAAPMIYVHERPEWEYSIVTKAENALLTEEELNNFGKDGWELTGVTAFRGQVQLVFKRMKV
jgi:hypothetical protein